MKTSSSSSILRESIGPLAEKIVARQYVLQPQDWLRHVSPISREKSVRDAGYHLTFLAEALEAQDAALFCEYLGWVRELFSGLGFSESVLPVTLECTRQALLEDLPMEASADALAVLDAGLAHLARVPIGTPGYLDGDGPYDELARSYLQTLLRADRHTASAMILQSVEKGASLKDIYSQVFQPSQRELGRLWQSHQITIAQEHFCTAATQMVMSQLYPAIFMGPRNGRCMVMACVGRELHEIGARMVADFFEMDGWDSYFLGANTPPEAVLAALEDRRADLLAISVTMTFHLERVYELIEAVRSHPRLARTRILVGGYPFNISAGLWRKVGADGFASSAAQAVQEAEKLFPA